MPEPEVSSADKTAPTSRPLGIHIYFYLLIAILLLCMATFIGVALLVADLSDPRDWMFCATLAAPVLFLVALWLALRRCSGPDLSGFGGILFITGYMSKGVGSYSVIVAVPATMIAIVGCLLIALASLFRADSIFAPRQFRRPVLLYYRHRMYQ